MSEPQSAPEVANSGEGLPPSGSGVVFVCDASAEAERLMGALRSRGYTVVDVPLGLLANRVRYEMPELVVVDADAHEAARHLEETRHATTTSLRLVLLGLADGALSRDSSLVAHASLVFVRPLEISRTADSLRELLGPAPQANTRPNLARGRGPLLVASARRPYRTDHSPPARAPLRTVEVHESHWPSAPSQAPLLPELPPLGELSPPPSRAPMHSSAPPTHDGGPNLSPETRTLLEQARRRVLSNPVQLSRPARLIREPSDPGAVSAELLAALAEPLGENEVSTEDPVTHSGDNAAQVTGRQATRATDGGTSARPLLPDEAEQTNPGGRPGSRGAENSTSVLPDEVGEAPAPVLSLPPLDDLSDLLAPLPRSGGEPDEPSSKDVPSTTPRGRRAAGDAPRLDTIQPGSRGGALRPPLPTEPFQGLSTPSSTAETSIGNPPLELARKERTSHGPPSAVLSEARPEPRPAPTFEGAPLERLALAIRERWSGALAQQTPSGVRRVMLRDGDLLTLTSSIEAESLVQFLVARGELTAEAADGLRNLPRFGRHAGAALVAQGKVRQEDLWAVLRGHAEWLLGSLLSASEALIVDENTPQRLLEEPAVFGGAAGSEIYVDVLRRVMQPQTAFARLGSGELALGWGPHQALLAETGLPSDIERALPGALEQPLTRVRDKSPQLLVVLCALTELGVLSTGGGSRPAPSPELVAARSAEMDDEAFATSLRARRALVEEGDYFSILGVARSATRYEIDRAREHWKRELDATRLTARNAHLVPELELVLSVVEEAHLVLSDDVRRERYRRALDQFP